ncbi:MAG: cyclic lactone autoinducer peptide [Lachnospiraceae bacterium]|nr:cyclic lactone autoinducer peptide [Lachnospiraceae bacterium]
MKKNTKKSFTTVIEKIAFKIAAEDANSACPCISYQPKLPKSVKKLRKF